MRDPQNVYPGQCSRCYTDVADDCDDLTPDGLCNDCDTEARLAALAEAHADDDADYTAALKHALAAPGVTPARSWLQIAADIVGVRR